MPRPRKYASEADAKAAKLDKQRQKRAAKHALKNDPTKRKDAAVNAEALPLAPVNDETMAAIRQIMSTAGELDWNGRPKDFGSGRLAAALMAEWEDDHASRLPEFEEQITLHGHTAKGVPITSASGEGYDWNRLHNALRIIVRFMERDGENKNAADHREKSDRKQADAAGLSVAAYRASREAMAIARHKAKTATDALKAEGESALAKRNARIEREGVERMKEQETFGRF
jgi:hypothetical protein